MADDDPPKKHVLPLRLTASRYGTRNLPPPLVERYTEMQTKIAELEKALAELPQIRPNLHRALDAWDTTTRPRLLNLRTSMRLGVTSKSSKRRPPI
jgi:hypothetical protein